MRILWFSTAPWGASSYSVLSKRTLPDIVRDGHEVIAYSWYGLQGQAQKWPITKREDKTKLAGNVTILPHCGGNPYGIDTALAYYQAIKPDVMISNMDVWVLPADVTSRMSFACWAPVDHDPVPQGILSGMSTAKYVMCYSQWGTQLLKDCGVEARYVPCSADSALFCPGSKRAAREALGLDPNWFIVSMIAANKDPGDRKGFGEALAGFAEFAKAHEDARLYVHTNWGGPINIANLAARCGIPNSRLLRHDHLTYLSGGYGDDYMVNIYRASDVLLNPAKSEGFGLPILEAQMCGTPVALSDYSTTDELLFAGWKIPGQRHWSIGADSWRVMVYIEAVTAALEEAYRNRGNELLARQARQGALSLDTAEVHRKHWRPALAEIEEIVKGGGALKMVTF